MDPERDRTERNVPHLISSTSYGTDVGYLPPPYTPGQGNATATDRTPLFYTVPTTNQRQGTSSNSRASTFLRAFCAIIAWLVLLTLSGFVLYYCGLLLVWIIQYSCLLFVWIVHYCGLLFMLIVHWLGNLLSPGSHVPPERHAPPDWHAPPERYAPCPNPEKPQPDAYERRVAIIGAGPSGVSTAYHLSQQAFCAGIPTRISLYDNSSHIGGRAVHVVDIVSGESLDLGSTTFSKAASLLTNAADYLGLETITSDDGTGDLTGYGSASFGVYDGRSWAYLEPNPGWFLVRWWWRFKLWFRYGWSQWRAEDLITDSRKKWETLYSSDHSFTSVASVVHDSGFDVFAGETAESLLKSKNIDGNFRREIFNPWVRGRYAQNLDTISALGAFMAADNSARLTISDGGMAGLWEGMVNSSAATVHLNTNVIGLRRGSWGGWVLASSSQSGGESYEAFDAVVLATPWSLTNLEIKGDALHVTPQNISYAEIYITLFTSAHGLAGGRFSGQKGIPGLVLTTPCSWEYEYISGGTGKDGMGHAPFWSLSRVKDVVRAGKREYVYKVVSAKQLSDDDIQKMLGGREKSFSWVYRYYSSAAHPLLQPRDTFSDILLDENLWYTGVIDELTTGVEMASVMGNNIASIVTEKWKAEGNFPPDDRRIPKEGLPGAVVV